MRQPRQPSYRLHRPTKTAVVTINGRDIYLGRHGSVESRAEYDRIIAEWMVNGRTAAAKGDDLSINELMLGFVEWAEGYYRKNGRETSQAGTVRLAVRPVRELYGHTAAKDFGPQALKAVRQQYINSRLARTEANRRTRIIVQAFKWATVEEIVPASLIAALEAVPPLLKGRTEAPERPPVGPVDDAHVDAVLPHVSSPVRTMIELQQWTGARPGEIVALRTVDVVPDEEGPGLWFVPESHKTEHHDKERRIYLGPRSRAILQPWLRPDDPGAYLFSPRASIVELAGRRRRTRHVNHKRRPTRTKRKVGERFSVDSYRRAIAIGIEKANAARAEGEPPVEAWHPHQIRHTVSGRISRELDIEAARTVLGHGHIKDTEGYTQRDFRKAARAMEKLG